MSLSSPASAQAQSDLSRAYGDIRRKMVFDIPAQPLDEALTTYAAFAGVQLFADADLMSNRRSSAVNGVMTPSEALQVLLRGSGVSVRIVEDRGYTLRASSEEHTDRGAAATAEIPAAVLKYRHYSASLQAALRTALCADEETTPGAYRFLVRLWISRAGGVAHADIVTSTGSRHRDALLLANLRGQHLGSPPPPNLPQPVTLLIGAEGRTSGYCGGPAVRRADRTGK